MSHLEKQAKTIKDFYQDCICQIISKGKHPKKFDEQQKWVPLKEAQKAFVFNEVLFKSAYIRITELEGKFEAANKKLAEFPKCRSFNHITQKFAEEDQEIKRWLEEMKVCLSQEEIEK